MTTEPQGAYMIWLPAGGAKAPPSAETIARGEHYVRMEGKETYRFATKTMATTALESIRKSGLTPDDIDLFIPHQANIRIIEAVAKGLDLPMDKMFVNLDKYGNTSAASVPIALAEAVNEGRVKVGDNVTIVAFGAGFTSGAVTIEWTADPARGAIGDAAVQPEDVHVRLPVDWDSVDPIPEALAEIMARPGTVEPAARRRRPGRAGARPPAAARRSPLRPSRPPAHEGQPIEAQLGRRRMIDLTGKSALVTGGSRGIGRAIALRLATQGADVAFSYRGNEAAAKEVVAAIEALGRRAVAVQADAADPESAETVVKAALEAFGKVDILVNNAGITRDDLIMRMSVDDFRAVLETNLFGAFYMTKAVTRPMLKARGGRIVNITSVSGQAGQMGQANYSSAKAGLIGLTKATARELASRSITCNAVAPGFVLTELTQDLPEALQAEMTTGRRSAGSGRPRRSPTRSRSSPATRRAFITGQVLAVDGGLVMM